MNNIDVYEKGLFYNLFKRTVDLIGSLFGLIFFSPVMLVIAIAIKLESKGPVFFIQERIGLNGKSFKMYKFRSMVVNAEELKESLQEKNEMSGPMFKIKDDPRITTIGKFIRRTSIDELPQFINVFLGEMSIVGPRPNLPNEVSKFTDYQKRKLLVKPGLTCYWQVMGRNNIDFEEWMELDVRYLRERSTWVDIKLIISTFKLIFGDNNAR
jgi:exopolysaccharide biosynthesis polyprenyl glycosylphosphotransferase